MFYIYVYIFKYRLFKLDFVMTTFNYVIDH